MVVHHIAHGLGGSELQPMGHDKPLMAHLLVTTVEAVVIVNISACIHLLVQVAEPMEAVVGGHLVMLHLLAVLQIQNQFFTERGLILQVKL